MMTAKRMSIILYFFRNFGLTYTCSTSFKIVQHNAAKDKENTKVRMKYYHISVSHSSPKNYLFTELFIYQIALFILNYLMCEFTVQCLK